MDMVAALLQMQLSKCSVWAEVKNMLQIGPT